LPGTIRSGNRLPPGLALGLKFLDYPLNYFNMKLIKLTQGKQAIVDDEDYATLIKRKWCVKISTHKKNDYAYGWVRGSRGNGIFMHREIMECPLGMSIDHINGNGLDNRKNNLRVCTQSQNRMNTRVGGNNYKGLSRNKNSWQVNIGVGGKKIYVGLFGSAADAARAYNGAAIKYHGEFAKLNKI